MTQYAKLDFVNTGYLNANRGFYALPGYGLKFAPLAVDGQVDTTAQFFDTHGTETPDEQDLALDVEAETTNTVNMKSKNSVICIAATAEAEGNQVLPDNRPRNVPVETPLLGKVPKFTSEMPSLQPDEIADGNTIDMSSFLDRRVIAFGKNTNDFSNNPQNGTGQWNVKYSSFGGQILFHPTSSDHTYTYPFSYNKSWDREYTYELMEEFATLIDSSRKNGTGTPIGREWKHSFRPEFQAKPDELIMRGGSTMPNNNNPAIDRMFYNKGVEFYTSTQLDTATSVVAGTGNGFRYQVNKTDGEVLRHIFSGDQDLSGAWSAWPQLNYMDGWYAGAVVRFRRNSNPANNAGYDGPVFEFTTETPVDPVTDFVPFTFGLYTYDENTAPEFARVGFKIAMRKGNGTIWEMKFNSPANSGKPGIVDYMMDTLTPDTDLTTGLVQYQPKFYQVGFGFRKTGSTINVVRPFVYVDNVYMEADADIDLQSITGNAGVLWDDSAAIENQEQVFGKMGILCSSAQSVRTGGPAADIYMFNSSLTSVIKPFSGWSGGLNENNKMHSIRNVMDKMADSFDTLGQQLGYDQPIQVAAINLKDVSEGVGYSTSLKTKGLIQYMFNASFFGAMPDNVPETTMAKVTRWDAGVPDYADENMPLIDWVERYYGPMYYGQTKAASTQAKTHKLILAPDRFQLSHPIDGAGTQRTVLSYDKGAYDGGFGFSYNAGVSFNKGMYIDIDSPTDLNLPDPNQAYVPRANEIVNFAWLRKSIDKQANGGSFEITASNSMWRASTADDFVGLDTVFNAGNNFKTLAIPFSTHKRDKIQQVQVYKKLADRYVQVIPNSVTIKNPTAGQPLILITMSSAIDIKVQL